MSELPAGWVWTTVGEVCEVIGGSTPKTTVDRYWGGPIAWVTPDDLSRHRSRGIASGARSLTEDGFRSASLTMLPVGAVLFSSRAPIGYVAIAEAPVCTNQGFKSVVPPNGISSDYLYWYLKHATPLIESMASGTTFKEISKRRMQEVPLPLPPLAEQERIVAAIEEHLSALDAAESGLDSCEHRAKLLEQRLIDEAAAGEVCLLGALLSEPLRNGLSARPSTDGFVRVATLTAVTQRAFIESNTKLIDPGPRSVDDLWMAPGDLFIQRSNTPELVGTAALFSGAAAWAIFPDLLIRVRVDRDRVEPSYLEVVLRSSAIRRYFQKAAQGIAGSMPKISQPVVEAAPIPLPSIEHQREIVRQVRIEMDGVGQLRRQARHASRRAEALRRSILAAAFSGRLVLQDPNDESASLLLERIRAERVAAAPTKRSRKAKAS